MANILQTVYHSSKKIHKNPHFHDCHQIILVVNGDVEFRVNNAFFTAGRGDIAIFSRYENHSVRVLSEEYERFVLHIDSTIVNRTGPLYSLLTDRPVGFCNIISILPHLEEVKNIFGLILREHTAPSELSDEMETLLIKQLLIILYRCTDVDFNDIYDDVVIAVKRQFENEYQKPFYLAALAKQHNLSISSLSHRFSAVTGFSVMEYLQLCRLANAKQMLIETDNSIGEIIEKCGFSDNSNFSRIFKKMNGLSPTDFRKKYKGM